MATNPAADTIKALVKNRLATPEVLSEFSNFKGGEWTCLDSGWSASLQGFYKHEKHHCSVTLLVQHNLFYMARSNKVAMSTKDANGRVTLTGQKAYITCNLITGEPVIGGHSRLTTKEICSCSGL